MSAFNVMGEDHKGNVYVIRKGFRSEEAAEDHPVTMKYWKRVWVSQNVKAAHGPAPEDAPLPWSVEKCGKVFTYIRDAENRRVMSLHGVLARRDYTVGVLRDAGMLEEGE